MHGAMRKYRGVAREMHPNRHGYVMPLYGRADGDESTGCARPFAKTGGRDIQTHGRRRPRETFGTFTGRDGTKLKSLIEADAVVAIEAVAGTKEASRSCGEETPQP